MTLLAAFLTPADAAPFTTPAPAFPISGYFIRAGGSNALNADKLDRIKAAGGDSILTPGARLKPAGWAELPADCKIGSVNCGQAATLGVRVNRVFTYSDGNQWGTKALACPRDQSIAANGKLFTILVVPADVSGCDSSDNSYDVIVISGGTTKAASATVSLAKAATKRKMRLYAGLPIPVMRNDVPYLPDLSYQNTFAQFTDRYLRYQKAVSNVAGLAGFYLAVEMPLSAGFDSVLTTYRIQNEAIHRIMPTRAAVVSPYLDARVAAGGRTPLAGVADAVRTIALTASGVNLSIAVQDGMGTGKGGAYFGNEDGTAVDAPASTIVGEGTWGTKYLASTRDYFQAAAAGVAGTTATLWANVEGMAPATGSNACDTNLRGQTTLARLDRQLQQVGNAPQKLISFMWDTYYTCVGTGTPLEQQLRSGKATPVITDSTFTAGTGAVAITGYNLYGAKVQVNWTDAAGQRLSKVVATDYFDGSFGARRGQNPRLQTVMANVGETNLSPDDYYTISVTNAWDAVSDADYAKHN
jgi:hypothetical protein